MKINIHKIDTLPGQNGITEITTAHTRILLDGGCTQEENAARQPIPQAFSDIDAVFLSHFHTDYVALSYALSHKTPVYAAKLTARIASAAQIYRNHALRLAEGEEGKQAPAFAGFYASGSTIVVGDIKVTPYLIDDPLYDGFLLLIEGDGKKAIYTGDYRAHGRKSFEEMLKNLPVRVDYLLCEEGAIAQEDINLVTERDLEEQAVKAIASHQGPVFLLQSPTDFDRAATMLRAAKRCKRTFLEDLYMSHLSGAAGEAMPNPAGWAGVKAYLTTGYGPEDWRYQLFTTLPRVSKADLKTQSFVMCMRPSMKKYIKTLSQYLRFTNGLLLCALREDGPDKAEVQAFLGFAASKGLEVVSLRSSGHADAKALQSLIEAVQPEKILPLCAKNADWLKKAYPQKIVLSDE